MPKPFEDYNKQIGGVDLCPHIEFALGQINGGDFSLHGWQTLKWQFHGNFFAL